MKHSMLKNQDSRFPDVEAWQTFINSSGVAVPFPIYSLRPYDQRGVPISNCAGYARRVADQVFGKNYFCANPALRNAWNLAYHFKSIPVQNFRALGTLVEQNLLVPGHLVGFYNPNSVLNGNQKDFHGHIARYTHMTAFMGRDTKNELVFGQQVIDSRELLTSEEMREIGFRPKVVILDTLLNPDT